MIVSRTEGLARLGVYLKMAHGKKSPCFAFAWLKLRRTAPPSGTCRRTLKHKVLALTYSHTPRGCITIGAEGLNCCVRNENRCDPFARNTRTLCLNFYSDC